MLARSISKDIKSDTNQLLEETQGLQLGHKQIIQEIHSMRTDNKVQFSQENVEELVGKMRAFLQQDPGNFLMQRYLETMTTYAGSIIDPNEYVPVRDSIWDPDDPEGPHEHPPEYNFEDANAPQDSKSLNTQVEGYFDQVKSEPLSPELHKRSVSFPINSGPRDPPVQPWRSISGDFYAPGPNMGTQSPTIASVSTEARSPTFSHVFSPGHPGSLRNSLSQITSTSLLPDLSWVEKQAEARHAREHTANKTLRRLNGELRRISSDTSQVIVEGLLLKGASPNAVNRKLRANVVDLHGLQSKEGLYNINRCALVNAICARNTECVRMLLAYGADPNIDDGCEQSCLFFAVAYGEEEIVEALIRAKADVNRVENLDVICAAGGDYTWPSGTPFLEYNHPLPAGTAGRVEIHCHSALMTAVSMAVVDRHPRRYAILDLLLAHGADATEKAHKDCHLRKERGGHATPLDLVVATASIQFCGGDDDNDDDDDDKGRETAIGDKQKAVIQLCRLLLDAGANINSLTILSKTQWMVTPLDRAVMRKPAALELAGLLVARGGNLSLGVDGAAKASKSQIGRIASGMNLLLITKMAREKDGQGQLEGSQQGDFSMQWLGALLILHRSLGVAMLLQLVAEFSFEEGREGRENEKDKDKEDEKHVKPGYYGREDLETAILQLRRCGITSREEGQIRYMRPKRFYDKNSANWAESQINAMTLVREMCLDETKISREELLKLVDGPLLR